MYIIRKIVILICTMLVVSAFCILCSATVRSIEKGYSASADKSNTEVNSDTELNSDTEASSDAESGNSGAESGNTGAESGAVSEPGLDSSDTSRDSGKNPSQDDSDVVLVCKGNLDGVSRELLIKLKDIVKSHPNSVSFYYENLDTGIAIAATPDKAYFCASVVKAPYIAAVLKKGVDTSEVVAIKEDVCNIPAGAELTVDQLIYYSLVHSDNNSYIELIRKYGRAVFNSYSEELGVSSRITSGHFCSMTAYEAAVYFKDIYSFALESADGKYLAEYMKKPIYNQQIGRVLSKKYPVLQKYGASYNRSVFHNTAVVCAPSPYVLSIFTDINPAAEESTKVFRDIAAVIDEINTAVAERNALPVNAEESAAD